MNEFLLSIDRYMLYCTSKGRAVKTMRSYEQTLRLFARYLEDEYEVTDVAKVKAEHIRLYVDYVRTRGKYTVVSDDHRSAINRPGNRQDFRKQVSDTTVANYLRNIKAFFSYLVKDGQIAKDPAKEVPHVKPVRKMKPLLNENELHIFFRAFDTSKFHEFRNWTIARLILDSGARIGELLELMPQDIDLKNNVMLMRFTKNKKERFIYFSFKMARNLRSWLEYRDRYTDSPYAFPSTKGNKMDIRNIEAAFRKVGNSVGLTVQPHMLRNNFAKYYLMNGGDLVTLSRILGHSSVEVTEQIYLDFSTEEIGRKYQRHSPLSSLDI